MSVAESVPGEGIWESAPVRRALGLSILGLVSGGRVVLGHEQVLGVPDVAQEVPVGVDVLLGIVDVIGEHVGTTTQRISDVLTRVLRDAELPVPLGASRVEQVAGGLAARISEWVLIPLAERGGRLRAAAAAEATDTVARVLPESVDLVLDQVDLTDLALERLDLDRVVRATLEQVDVAAIARDQVDPARVAAYLRENVDLAEVVRTAPGDAVRGVVDTVGRIVPGRQAR